MGRRAGVSDFMKRLHLFEFEDQPWFPSVIRDAGTAYLRHMFEMTGHAALMVPTLTEALAAAKSRRIVDLCSGGGGPIFIAVRELRRSGVRVHATLTDRYPSHEAFRHLEHASEGAIGFVESPVDARQVPPDLRGLRTLFNALHHFRPDEAREILRDAARNDIPIAVFEIVGRELFCMFGILFSWLAVLLVMPFIRPLRPSWIFFTYVIPVIPLFVLWDGVVSCLRVYSLRELETLVAPLREEFPGYEWKPDRVRLGKAPAHAITLLGRPTRLCSPHEGAR